MSCFLTVFLASLTLNFVQSACPFLNPYTDSIRHPDSDPDCESGLPGWNGNPDCQCRFLIKDRDANRCVVSYYSYCKIGNVATKKPTGRIPETTVPIQTLPTPHPGFPPAPGTKCSEAREAILFEIKERGLRDYPVPACNPRGNYEKVQCSGFPNACWCVDEISGSEIPGSRIMDTYPARMRCPSLSSHTRPPPPPVFPPPPGTKCSKAREAALFEMEHRGLMDYPVPSCDSNGNYNPVQCSGFPNACWCVNPETGIEIPDSFKMGAFQNSMVCQPQNEDKKNQTDIENVLSILTEIVFPTIQRYLTKAQESPQEVLTELQKWSEECMEPLQEIQKSVPGLNQSFVPPPGSNVPQGMPPGFGQMPGGLPFLQPDFLENIQNNGSLNLNLELSPESLGKMANSSGSVPGLPIPLPELPEITKEQQEEIDNKLKQWFKLCVSKLVSNAPDVELSKPISPFLE